GGKREDCRGARVSGSAAERSRQQSRQTATLLAFRHGVPLRSAKTTRTEIENKQTRVCPRAVHSFEFPERQESYLGIRRPRVTVNLPVDWSRRISCLLRKPVVELLRSDCAVLPEV